MTTSTSPPAALPQLDEMLCFLVYSAGSAFNRVYRKPLENLGLTYPQYLVMLALWAQDGVTVGRIGEQLGLDTGTLTPLLKRLEALGLLARERSSHDERRVIVTLTDTGRALHARARDVKACISEAVDLSPEDAALLMQRLKVLRAHLEAAAR